MGLSPEANRRITTAADKIAKAFAPKSSMTDPNQWDEATTYRFQKIEERLDQLESLPPKLTGDVLYEMMTEDCSPNLNDPFRQMTPSFSRTGVEALAERINKFLEGHDV